MTDSKAGTFGYISAWARGKDEGLEGLLSEYAIPDGIAIGGGVTIKADQAQALIEYLSDPANLGEYGIKLDFALFYKEEDKVPFSGRITVPYSKGSGNNSKSAPASSRAKRAL